MEPISLLPCHLVCSKESWAEWKVSPAENFKSLPLFPSLYRCALHAVFLFCLSYSLDEHYCLNISSSGSSKMTQALKSNHEKWVMLVCRKCRLISSSLLFGFLRLLVSFHPFTSLPNAFLLKKPSHHPPSYFSLYSLSSKEQVCFLKKGRKEGQL